MHPHAGAAVIRARKPAAYLALGVLVGLLANTAFGMWWLDPVIALMIAGLAEREGIQTWRGSGCDCAVIPDLAENSRHDDCCR